MKNLIKIVLVITAIGVAVKVLKKPQLKLFIDGKALANHLENFD